MKKFTSLGNVFLLLLLLVGSQTALKFSLNTRAKVFLVPNPPPPSNPEETSVQFVKALGARRSKGAINLVYQKIPKDELRRIIDSFRANNKLLQKIEHFDVRVNDRSATVFLVGKWNDGTQSLLVLYLIEDKHVWKVIDFSLKFFNFV